MCETVPAVDCGSQSGAGTMRNVVVERRQLHHGWHWCFTIRILPCAIVPCAHVSARTTVRAPLHRLHSWMVKWVHLWHRLQQQHPAAPAERISTVDNSNSQPRPGCGVRTIAFVNSKLPERACDGLGLCQKLHRVSRVASQRLQRQPGRALRHRRPDVRSQVHGD